MLAEKNRHERDHNVKYNDESHTYRVEYNVIISVTKLVHICFPEFNKDIVAEKKSLIVGKTKEEVIKEWETLAKKGSDYHKMIENYLNSQSTACHSGFLEYHEELLAKGWEPFRTEMTIWGGEIAGTVDAIYQHKDTKKFLILDWKHCRKIYKTSVDNTKGYYFLDHLENCNYNHYMLQIGIYRHILEKYYNFDVEDAYVVNIFNAKRAYSYKLKDYKQIWEPLVIKLMDFVFTYKNQIINHLKN